jgi:hypothetical protein
MSKFNIESPAGKSEWKQAYQAVCHLASAQQQLRGDGENNVDHGAIKPSLVPRTDRQHGFVETGDSQELAQAILEIEHAANALQEAQPSLETWVKQDLKQGRRPKALLILILTLWLATTMTTLAVATTIAYYLL